MDELIPPGGVHSRGSYKLEGGGIKMEGVKEYKMERKGVACCQCHR